MKIKITEHIFFLFSVLLKGLNGVFEIAGGFLLVFFPPPAVIKLANFLTQNEIREDSRDLVANYLIHAAQNYSVSFQVFWSAYFFAHGIIKVFLVAALLRRRLWAYPSAILVFALFIVYQLYRFSHTHSPFLIVLSAFDILVIILTSLEYNRIKRLLTLVK
jgi:uncharacterized membrane protein